MRVCVMRISLFALFLLSGLQTTCGHSIASRRKVQYPLRQLGREDPLGNSFVFDAHQISTDRLEFASAPGLMLTRYSLTHRQCERFSALENPYVVAFVFAGRRDRMQILMRYMAKLLLAGDLHEIHMWDLAKNPSDSDWIHDMSNNDTVKPLEDPGGKSYLGAYSFYHGQFTPVCAGADPSQTLLVKSDDDIVFLDVAKFGSFVNYIHGNTDKFLVHANVVNNGVAAYYQVQHIADIIPDPMAAALADYPNGGQCGYLWEHGDVALELHKAFVSHATAFAWSDANASDCVVFRAPGSSPPFHGQGRFSINFFGFRLSVIDSVCKLVAAGGDDEAALTTVATANGLEECMYTPFNVAHLSFFSQAQAVDASALPLYEQMANAASV